MVTPADVGLTPHELAELISTGKWLIGGAFAGIAAVLGFLLRLSYTMGGHVTELKEISSGLSEIKERADEVPVIRQRVEHLEELYRRNRSDIKDLIMMPRPSRPGFDPGE